MSFIGRILPPFSFDAVKSKIRELVRAFGDDNPILVDDEIVRIAGLPGIVAPPIFPTLFKMWGEGGNYDLFEATGGTMLRVRHGKAE